MILRPALPEDLTSLADLEADLFGADAWPARLLAGELEGPDRYAVVAVDPGAPDVPFGFVVTRRSGDAVDLQRIAVRPDHQRRGVAGRLLEQALTRATADGADAMLLEVSADNGAALAFYVAGGFEEIDRRRRYYRDGSDAVVMRRTLTTGPGQGRG